MDTTLQFLPVLVVGFTTALGLTPLSRQIAFRLGVVAKPNHRTIHLDHKPMMGGLAIFLGFIVALVLFSPPRYLAEMGAVLVGSIMLGFTGLVDDRFDISPQSRLVVETIASCLLIAAGIQIRLFNIPLLDYPITIIWVIAMINALNFLDNMDGLCAGIAAIASAFFLLIALLQGLTLVSLLAAALLGSTVGFLIHNFNPASTFMGDMGAYVIGYVLATLAMKVDYWMPPVNPYWAIPALVMIIPIFDITLVVFSRYAEGHPLMVASKNHTSHRLMSLGLSQRKTLLILYGTAVFFGIVAVALTGAAADTAWIIVALCVVLVAYLAGLMVYIRYNFPRI